MDSKELEQKAAKERRQAVQTGHEINNDLSPGALLDRYYFRGGDATLSGYLSRVKEDPIPGALIGAAVAWTIGQEERDRHPRINVEVSAMDRLEREGSSIGVSQPSNNEKGTLDKGREKFDETLDSTKHSLSDVSERVSSAAHDLSDKVGSTGKDLRSRGEKLFNSEPLINVALGYSLGAALGAMTPMSQPEHDYLSSSAEKLKDEAYRMKDKATDMAKDKAQSLSKDMSSDDDMSDDIVRH